MTERHPGLLTRQRPGAPSPFLLIIDVEPDERLIPRDGTARLDGFPALVEEMSALRDRLADASGSAPRFTWCMRFDPQVSHAFGSADHLMRAHEGLVARLLDAGDEIGTHTHFHRWCERDERWVIDHGDPAWVEHCVESSLDAYEAAFGRPCRSHRCGDRFMTTELVDVLERRGVRYDLTVEPGEAGASTLHPEVPSTGAIPDYTDAPRHPYRPSLHDFRLEDPGSSRRIQEIPLTSVSPSLRLRAARALRRMPAPRDGLHAMWHGGGDAAAYWDVAAAHRRRQAEPYLAFAIRSEALVEDWVAARIRPRLRSLPDHTVARGSWFTTPTRWLGGA